MAEFQCEFDGCDKAFPTENALKMHVVRAKHGKKSHKTKQFIKSEVSGRFTKRINAKYVKVIINNESFQFLLDSMADRSTISPITHNALQVPLIQDNKVQRQFVDASGVTLDTSKRVVFEF